MKYILCLCSEIVRFCSDLVYRRTQQMLYLCLRNKKQLIMNAINKENSKVFLLILLGMLSAFGPFVTDMYLPSLPAMADYFSASLPMVQMGLTTSMIGLALGQIFFGPLSDKYGRRPLLRFRCYCLSCPRCFVFLHRTFIRLSLCG